MKQEERLTQTRFPGKLVPSVDVSASSRICGTPTMPAPLRLSNRAIQTLVLGPVASLLLIRKSAGIVFPYMYFYLDEFHSNHLEFSSIIN